MFLPRVLGSSRNHDLSIEIIVYRIFVKFSLQYTRIKRYTDVFYWTVVESRNDLISTVIVVHACCIVITSFDVKTHSYFVPEKYH